MKWQRKRRSATAESSKRTLRRSKKTRRVNGARAGGEWTEAAFWGFLRSGFRDMSRRWPPIVRQALERSRRPYVGTNKRQKWEYRCATCGKWFKGDAIKVDHIQPAGTLKKWDDVRGFLERLFVEVDGLRCLCAECHETRTAADRSRSTRTEVRGGEIAGLLFDTQHEPGDDCATGFPF